MTTTDPENPQQPTPSNPREPFLSLYTTVVLLTAIVIGLTIGALTVFTGAPAAAAVIAGITSTGASVPVLRSLIQ
ncbi:hypothetical protein [Streptomyces sp. NPDC005953]|uniref:hypothetical protein n=1 Tax=Streptomyces sp. NPDC005953 TaxID=3156719 RepID=UPI0033D7AFC0